MTDTMFTIGGEDVPVPSMNFKALKVALPAARAISTESDVVSMTSQVILILEAALAKTRPDLTADVIEDRLTGPEMEGLMANLPKLMQASGLIKDLPPDAASGEAGTSIQAA
jgi:hypothetical protein